MDTAKAIMMEHYHQQNSEIDNMSIEDVSFLLSLYFDKELYKKQKIEQNKNR